MTKESDSPPRRSRRSDPREETPSNLDIDLEHNGSSGRLPPTPPPRSVSFKKNKSKDFESPGIKTVGTEDTTLTINHVQSTKRSGGGMALGRPIMGLIGLFVLFSLGAGVWGFLRIPGLYKQIKELEHQVDRLEGQVDRLEGEVNRFENLNQQLNATVVELEGINQDLNTTANRLEAQVDELEIINDELSLENERFRQLNDELKESTDELALEVGKLEENVGDLTARNAELRNLTIVLQGETDRLGDQVDSLNTTAASLAQENERLQSLNSNLATIVGFLNETNGEITETLEGVTEFLADQIVGNRQLLLANLENSFSSQINNWDCAFRDTFRGESFILDEDSPIGINNVGEVLAHVEDRILSEFCANRIDFENYLEGRYGLSGMTANQLYQGVAIYTNDVLNYYFPDPGRPGLTPDDWAEAGYDCVNVPDFSFGSSV